MEHYRIGQFAQKTGLTARALRFYESKGLITAQRHWDNDYRYYTAADLEQVARIQFLKQLGFSLEQISELLPLLTQPAGLQPLREQLQAQLLHCQQSARTLAEQQRQIQAVLQILADFQTLSTTSLKALTATERDTLMTTLEYASQQLSTLGQRPYNDDYSLSLSFPHGQLCLIADGMRVQQAAAHASQLACEYIAQHLQWQLLTPEQYAAHFQALLADLNQQLYLLNQEAKRQAETVGIAATTLSFLALAGGQAFIGHVGDTRIYRYQQGQLTQLTQDHSLVQQQLDAGEILQRDLPNHPQRTMLYSIVGHAPEIPRVWTCCETVPTPCQYLLFSDGITQVLSESEIIRVLQQSADLDQALQTLITLAEKHGEDNATALGISVS